MTKEITKEVTASKAKMVPWRWWIGLAFIISAYYLSQIFSGMFLFLYGAIMGWSSEQTTDWLGSGSVYAQFFFILITELLVVGAVWGLLKHYRVGWSTIGLRRPKWSDLGHALIIAPAYFLVFLISVGIATWLFPGFDVNQTQDIGFDTSQSGLALVIIFISLVVLPPIAEEIMARGVLYGSLKKAMSVVWAALFTSVLFAIPHLMGAESGGLLYIAGLDTFILSMFLIYLREKTDGLWASMALHALKNGVAFVALFVLHVA